MFYLSREELLEHLRASGHPKGVFSTASRGLEVPRLSCLVSCLCLTFVLHLSDLCLTSFVLPLSYLVSCCEFHLSHLSLQVPVEQETLTLSFMEEEEEDRAPGGFQARKVDL